MTLKEAHEYLIRAYGVEEENGKVTGIAQSGVPWKLKNHDAKDVFKAWQVIADRLNQ